jgi:hypothetical protein
MHKITMEASHEDNSRFTRGIIGRGHEGHAHKYKNQCHYHSVGRLDKEDEDFRFEGIQGKNRFEHRSKYDQRTPMSVLVDTSIWVEYFRSGNNSEELDF